MAARSSSPIGALVDAHHAFGPAPVEGDQGVADQDPRAVLFGRRHRVFEVEDDAVGAVKTARDHQLGLIAGNVEPAPAQALAAARFGCGGGGLRQNRRPVEAGAPQTGLDPRQNHPLEGARVDDRQTAGLESERRGHPPHRGLDGLAVEIVDLGSDVEDQRFRTRLVADMEIGTNAVALWTRRSRRLFSRAHRHLPTVRLTSQSASMMASVNCPVVAAPWETAWAPPRSLSMS